MDKSTFDYVEERVDILVASGASTQVTKDAANAWKDAIAAVGADAADEATTQLLDVLEGRPSTIDDVIAFAEGPAKEMLGDEAVSKLLAEQQSRKQAGAKYCNCDACAAASELLARFGRIEL